MLILEELCAQKIHTLAFSPDGRLLASVTGRSTAVKLWDLDARRVCAELSGHSRRVTTVAFTPREDRLATATSTGELWFWTLSPPRCFRQVQWPRGESWVHTPAQVIFSPDGKWLASNIQIPIRLITFDGVHELWAQDFNIAASCLAFSPDGRRFAAGSYDCNVHLFDFAAKRKIVCLRHGKKVHYIAFSPDGTTLASGSPGGLVKVWDATTGHKRVNLKGQARPLYALCYSPDGRTIATAGGEGRVTFWDPASGRSRLALDWGVGEVHAVAFAPDGMRAAAGGVGKIVVWDVDDWEV